MKIWIISSDPFLDDFEKIARVWVKKEQSKVQITTLSKYTFGIVGMIRLFKEYLIIKPDKILTDQGHLAFFLIRIYQRLFGFHRPITILVRGNYWLESEKYV